MKYFRSLCVSVLAVLLCATCSDEVTTTGVRVLPVQDEIIVAADTFALSSELMQVDFIYSAPDSFLLGECDNQFGTIRSDILAQLACPINYKFPEGAVPDSAQLFLYYGHWFGNGYSPMNIMVYEMDKSTFNYASKYRSNLPIADYCSMAENTFVLKKPRTIVAAHPTDTLYSKAAETYIPFIRLRLTDEFIQRFFSDIAYTSQETFSDFFKGFYITTNFGSASLLYITQIDMSLYYHFSYEKNGRDTTVNDVKSYYANSEVRQVNRIDYIKRNTAQLEATDSLNYIVSPANMYTRISLPLKQICDTINKNVNGKRAYVNEADLTIDVLNLYTGLDKDKTIDDWAQPTSQMLLIKESALERFFSERELPSDTCAILSAISATTQKDITSYYFSYDLSTLLTNQLRTDSVSENLNMVLVPVTVETTTDNNSNTIIKSVQHQQAITATTIRSAKNAYKPMNLKVLYSGF